MKQGIIRGECLTKAQARAVFEWMKANGVRHYVPADAVILVHGNRFTVETFDIERAPYARPAPKKISRRSWAGKYRSLNLPRKTRTYRIRYDLKDIK